MRNFDALPRHSLERRVRNLEQGRKKDPWRGWAEQLAAAHEKARRQDQRPPEEVRDERIAELEASVVRHTAALERLERSRPRRDQKFAVYARRWLAGERAELEKLKAEGARHA